MIMEVKFQNAVTLPSFRNYLVAMHFYASCKNPITNSHDNDPLNIVMLAGAWIDRPSR